MYISTGLIVPAPEIQGLIDGQIIAVITPMFITPGRSFVLYPTAKSFNSFSWQENYKADFFSLDENAIKGLNADKVVIKTWAKCEKCETLDQESNLSNVTIWTKEGLEQILLERSYIFLTYLRVYLLHEPLEMKGDHEGKFVALPQRITVDNYQAVLSDRIFTQRKELLQKRLPYQPSELEQLQAQIYQLININEGAKILDQNISIFLNYDSDNIDKKPNDELKWIETIAKLGNRSKELDEGKSNYQAGTDFENITRKSLEFLGFKVDYFHRGGAGGIDVYCTEPYPLVIECKAGRKIPNDTAVQLLNLATLRLKDEKIIKKVTKLIIGPGEPTKQLKEAAKVHNMSILNPQTLEELVKLQATYPNSANLFTLKNCLKSGKTDQEVMEYITTVKNEIKQRSQIITAVKKQQELGQKEPTIMQIHTAYNTMFATNQNSAISEQIVRDILIELSSPLTGYLGKITDENHVERFYYLRDLV
jgi:Domain of unknown function (DUF1802)